MGTRTEFLPRSVAAREHRRRRVLLVSIAGLLVASTSPVLGHHVARGTEALFRGADHLGRLCLVALHELLAPVHVVFHVVLAAGLAFALWDRARAWRRARSTIGALDARLPEVGDPFWVASAAAGLESGTLRVVDGLPVPAFTTGWWRPRIYVAQRLVCELTSAEVAAVVAHEAAHVHRRDPLRLSLLRLLAYTLFWIPALRRLAADVADEAEIQADDAAAGDEPLVLASALLALAAWRERSAVRPAFAGLDGVGFSPSGATSEGARDILERRVRRLAGEPVLASTHVTRRSIVLAAAALMLAWASGAIVAHPIAERDGLTQSSVSVLPHCAHHHLLAVFHLFCPGAESEASPVTTGAGAPTHCTHVAT